MWNSSRCYNLIAFVWYLFIHQFKFMPECKKLCKFGEKKESLCVEISKELLIIFGKNLMENTFPGTNDN